MNRVQAIHQATVAGDVDALRALFGNVTAFPNVRDECGDACLAHAIADGPLELIQKLLALGADATYHDPGGFPALFAALDRPLAEREAVLELLLAAGADMTQRGFNDYTVLHYAAWRDDAEAVEWLLRHGADPTAATRIDHYATALQEAERLGRETGASAIRRWLAKSQ